VTAAVATGFLCVTANSWVLLVEIKRQPLQRDPAAEEPEAPAGTIACGQRLYLLPLVGERLVILAALVDTALVGALAGALVRALVRALVGSGVRLAGRIAWPAAGRGRFGGCRAHPDAEQTCGTDPYGEG